jgi:hypothetical protein
MPQTSAIRPDRRAADIVFGPPQSLLQRLVEEIVPRNCASVAPRKPGAFRRGQDRWPHVNRAIKGLYAVSLCGTATLGCAYFHRFQGAARRGMTYSS